MYAYEDADAAMEKRLPSNGSATFDLPDLSAPARIATELMVNSQPLWASYEVLVEASLDDEFSTGVETETFITLPPEPVALWGDAEKTKLGLSIWLSHYSGTPHTVYYRWRAQASITWEYRVSHCALG